MEEQAGVAGVGPGPGHLPLAPLLLSPYTRQGSGDMYSAGIFKQYMGARNQVGIGLSYRIGSF